MSERELEGRWTARAIGEGLRDVGPRREEALEALRLELRAEEARLRDLEFAVGQAMVEEGGAAVGVSERLGQARVQLRRAENELHGKQADPSAPKMGSLRLPDLMGGRRRR